VAFDFQTRSAIRLDQMTSVVVQVVSFRPSTVAFTTQGYDEKHVDETAPYAPEHSQEPEDQQHGEKCPEHAYLPP